MSSDGGTLMSFISGLKVKCSGLPRHLVTEESIAEWVHEVNRELGVDFKPEDFIQNSSLRQICKIALNSRFGNLHVISCTIAKTTNAYSVGEDSQCRYKEQL